ncbi:GreA/GreB family elongation factor [Pseudochrobactrum sp. MP213Fo]|uniref:GreA/GreB family elongation factor n=1 Tax=Pseudochrobactrum sp. MP213Fo TaxID=3022250 RepID=UPI003B9EA049
MSRAFTKELDDMPVDLGERPVSTHRNLVTANGMKLIEAELARLQDELGLTTAAGDKSLLAQVSRELRYWTSRRETAELSIADNNSDVVRFGMRVTVENEDGRQQIWGLVGEDEAEPSKGTISHISPMAVGLFGKGNLVTINGRELEIISFKAIDENV